MWEEEEEGEKRKMASREPLITERERKIHMQTVTGRVVQKLQHPTLCSTKYLKKY